MSGLPSPSKSAAAAIRACKGEAEASRAAPAIVVPSMNATAEMPRVSCCKRMSALPSSLKSATAAIRQLTEIRGGVRGLASVAVSSSIAHSPTNPSTCSCQRRSALPSPVQSTAGSSLRIVPWASPRTIVPKTGPERTRRNVSFASRWRSPRTEMLTVRLVSPGAKARDPAAPV